MVKYVHKIFEGFKRAMKREIIFIDRQCLVSLFLNAKRITRFNEHLF